LKEEGRGEGKISRKRRRMIMRRKMKRGIGRSKTA
jgi:hypothetical protein